MKPNTYILVFTDLLEAIHELPMKVQDTLAGAIVRYLAFAEQPDFKPLALKYRATAVALWKTMEATMRQSRRRRNADDSLGAEGGDSLGADECDGASDTGAHAITPDRTPAHDNKDIDKDIDIDKDNISLGDADASSSSGKPDDAAAASSPTDEMADGQTDDTTTDGTPDGTPDDDPYAPKKPRITGEQLYREILKYFNANVEGRGIPKIKSLRGKRRRTLDARLREYGSDAVAEVICNAADSRFLNGDNKNGFIASFDWLMSPGNFVKVWDGNYNS